MRILSGIHVPHFKNTAEDTPVRIALPDELTVPMAMHIGAPCKNVVEAGDEVKVGQVIGEPAGFVGAPIHSPVSGKVKAVSKIQLFNGMATAVVIEPDGNQTISDTVVPPVIEDTDSFLKALRASGLVGLGGAGFPASVKFTIKEGLSVDYLLINGAECEPYLTSDYTAMMCDTDDMIRGLSYLKKYVGYDKAIIGIESNKPKAIELFKSKKPEIGDFFDVKELPSSYPQGGEKVLIYNLTGRVVPAGKLPLDVGCIVINVSSLAFLGKYIKTGMPLIEKCVTVDGSAVAKPGKYICPIGTKASYVFEMAGGFKEEPKKFVMGGLMMGIALPNGDIPIMKNTGGLLALNEKDSVNQKSSECINCGRCVKACPMSLMPNRINKAYLRKDKEELRKLNVGVCMECGCCAYVCPAKRDLVLTHKLAKAFSR